MKKVVKILYILRSLLLIPLMFAIMKMLDSLFNTGFIGIVLFILAIILVITGIVGMLSKNHNMNKLISYNILFILLEIFMIVISAVYKNLVNLGIYKLNVDYFKTIYLFFIVIIVGVLFNTIIAKYVEIPTKKKAAKS